MIRKANMAPRREAPTTPTAIPTFAPVDRTPASVVEERGAPVSLIADLVDVLLVEWSVIVAVCVDTFAGDVLADGNDRVDD
jgi:hypothetical protein